MSDIARFPVKPGETVTAFALSALKERSFKGIAQPMKDTVDYKFVNGFVDVGDLPCRLAVWEEIKTRKVDLEPFTTETLNLPGFSRRLDFSHFWHRPTRLARWAKTTLIPPQEGTHEFRIGTCGGVHVWVDGKKCCAFEPYTRNKLQEQNVLLPLKDSGSEVVLLIEDIAERDTSYFLELTWLGEGDLISMVSSMAAADEVETLKALARDIRPTKVVFGPEDELVLNVDQAPATDVLVTGKVGRSVHLSHLPPLFSAKGTLRKGDTSVSLGSLGKTSDGYHPLSLSFQIGETRVDRKIDFALLKQASPSTLSGDLKDRKAKAQTFAAKAGEPRIGRLLAMLDLGLPFDDAAQAILDETLDGINSRRDCSDFTMVPLLWLYGAYRDQLPQTTMETIEAAILGYRYWMTEPGNDSMWFWSENHVLCFHVSEYIAGRLLPDEIFPNSGLKGKDHQALAEKRLVRWFDAIEDHGLAEWNSAAYYPIDFIGLIALYHWASEPLRSRSKDVIDQLFEMIALHTIGGVPAGSMGRAYDKELRAGPLNELTPFATVAFGKGWLNDGVAALTMFCASDYEPPKGLQRLSEPEPQTEISAHYRQGFDSAARLALHKTAHVQLSASIDAKPGTSGHQQHLVDVQFAARPFARLWINHPGEDDPWGSARPSYWSGNGIMPRVGMVGGTGLVLNDLGAGPLLDFMHVYAPLSQFDEWKTGKDWLLVRSGEGFALIKSTGHLKKVTTGAGSGIEFRAFGNQLGFALIVGDLSCEGLAALTKRAEAMELRLAANPLQMHLMDPDQPHLMLDHAKGLYCNGEHRPFPNADFKPQVIMSSHPEISGDSERKVVQ